MRRITASRRMFRTRFVLVVAPSGWRSSVCRWAPDGPAYEGRAAQTTVAAALGLIAACWVWASRILRFPRPERMFS